MVLHYHRPMHAMYSDNYRYGTSLYTVGDVEKKYRDTLCRTHLRSDRGDLGLYTFAGSHLHGGSPAVSKGVSSSGSKVTNADLYEPLSFGYGRSYYNHLRASTPIPASSYKNELDYSSNVQSSKSNIQNTQSNYQATQSNYQTTKSNVELDNDLKKTVTTTTTTERWVPLTTYIYNSPYHTYYYKSSPYASYTYRNDDLYNYDYLDDYKRTTTKTTRSKNIDALDLSVSAQNYEKFDFGFWKDKCSDIHNQLEQLKNWVTEADMRIKTDVVGAKNKFQTELTEVALVVADTTKYNEELQRVIKRQARQITDLSSQYDEINRHIGDVTDALEKSRAKCLSLQGELSSVQTGLDMVLKRTV